MKTQDGIILGLGATDVAWEVVSTMDGAEPLLPLGELRIEHRLEGRLSSVGKRAEAEQGKAGEAHGLRGHRARAR